MIRSVCDLVWINIILFIRFPLVFEVKIRLKKHLFKERNTSMYVAFKIDLDLLQLSFWLGNLAVILFVSDMMWYMYVIT